MIKQMMLLPPVYFLNSMWFKNILKIITGFCFIFIYQVNATVIDLDFSNQDSINTSAQGVDSIWGLGPTYSENVIYFKNVATHEGVTIDAKISTTVFGSYTWDAHFPNYKQNTTTEPNGDVGFRYWSSSLGVGGLNYLFQFYDGTGVNSGTYTTPYVLEKFEIIAYDVDGEGSQSENLRVEFSDGLVAWQTGTNPASLVAAPSATDVLFSGPRVNQQEDDPTGAVLLHFEDTSQFTLYFESQTFYGSSVNPIFSAIDGNWDLEGFGETSSSLLDYGDAPDTYGTTIAASGASHIATSSLYLGASKPDTDADGQPSASSDADDVDEPADDEDGIVTLTTLEAGKIALIQATVYGDGYLHAWADFNNNGTFDGDEAILVNYPVSTGNEVIPILISPSSLTGADVQFRFRLSTQTDLAATGASTEGEVEDHQFTISDPGIGYVYYPGAGQFYTFAAEDTWPDTFDYDLNDVVMIYRNTLVVDSSTTDVIRLDINGQLTAYGAGYHNGFAVHVPGLDKSDIDSSRTLLSKNSVPQVASPLEAEASETVVIVSSDLRSESIIGECLYHRVDPSCTEESPKFSFHAYLPLLAPTPQASMPTGAFDPFIFAAGQHRGSIIGVSPGRSLEIHTADFAPTSVGDTISSSYYATEDDDSSSEAPVKYYKTAGNMPWAIIIPVEWNHPSEYIDISEAYPNFPAWVTSGGTTNENWYLSEQANTSKTWTAAD